MSVASLYDAFITAAAQGRIDAGILPLMGKLVAVLGVDQLSLDSGQAVRLSASAVLTGSAGYATVSWTLTLTGTEAAGKDKLALRLQAQTADGFVAFATLVSDLPQSRVPSTDVGGALALGPSNIAALGPQQARIEAEVLDDAEAAGGLPALSGWLMLSGTALASYAAALGGNRLSLSGLFDPRSDAATADKVRVVAATPTAPTGSTAWGALQVAAISLRLGTDYSDPYSLQEVPEALSAVLMALTLVVDTGQSHAVSITMPLLQSTQLWGIAGTIEPALTLYDGARALQALFPAGTLSSVFALPSGASALNAFGLSELSYGITNSGGSLPLPTGISYTSATITSTTSWDLPLPFLSIERVGAKWLMMGGTSSSPWGGSVFGTMRFGAKTADGTEPPGQTVTDARGDPVYLDVAVSLPDLSVEAQTRGDIVLDPLKAMSVFFPGAAPDVGPDLIVTNISASASIPAKTFGTTLTITGNWPISVGDVTFTLDSIDFTVTVSPAAIWGGLAGVVGVSVSGEQKATLSAGAYYPGDGSWQFQGGLATGSLNLTELAYAFLGQTPPDWLPALELTELWAVYSTAAGNPYEVSAAVAALWDPEVLGLKLALTAAARILYRPVAEASSALAAADTLRLKSLARQRPRLHETALAAGKAGDAPTMIYEGTVSGSFTLNGLTISTALSFLSDEQTWLFGVQLDRFTLTAHSSWTGEGRERHQVLTVTMQGVTLGTMIESFATLANPNANYRLEAPWTFLNSIDLGRFTLVIDPTEQSVTLDYTVNLDLAFIAIRSVGLRYDRSTGEPQVKIELTGTFLGQEYGNEAGRQPLAWDALNDSPPTIPGSGGDLVDLNYLGFGQHVSLTGLTRPNSISAIIALMRQQFQQTDDSDLNPLDQPSGSQMVFDESSQWLIGLDLTVMGAASVKLVMHDPDLYGLLIALTGSEAGSLAGFSFELLYKKVTNAIGVFHARLQVPDAFRQFDVGAVALTLGVISVDIYTNGNFEIDFGFPQGRDFSVSFGLQYGPFLGKGGLYFGLLNGTTSSRVPAITNGTFSPVVELGLGLSVSVGRTFNDGPLKAGLYVQLEVIFEGVLAWFNPDDAAASRAMYYWAQGTAALVGKVYGKVDFKIIAVEVSFKAYAMATLTLAACRPTRIEMRVGVSVHASVKVAFVRISFSFKTSLAVSFTIGSASTTPWLLSSDQSGRSVGVSAASSSSTSTSSLSSASSPAAGGGAQPVQPLASASRGPGVRRRRRPADVARLTRQATRLRLGATPERGLRHPLAAQQAALADTAATAPAAADYRLNFSPSVKVFSDGAHAVDVRLVPVFTVASVPVNWDSDGEAPTNDAPAYRIVYMLTMDGPIPAEAPTLEAARTAPVLPGARTTDPTATAFTTLAEALFRWSVAAVGVNAISGTLTAGDVEELAAQMDAPQTFADGFTFDNLSEFFSDNILIRLSGWPEGAPETIGSVAFPMPPVLGWTSPDLSSPDDARDFASWQPVDNAYAARIEAWFRKIAPQPTDDDAGTPTGIADGESLASVVFREYMLLVAKSMVQAAKTLFSSFPVAIDATTTLGDLAAGFPTVSAPYVTRLDDTAEQVAETFGYGMAELLGLNPGLSETLVAAAPATLIHVTLGVTPESIAAANPDRALADGITLTAAALETRIAAGETATALCTRLGADADAWLQTATALDASALTRADATLAQTGRSFANDEALSLAWVAALFYVRFNAGTPAFDLIPEAGWYAEAIVQLNKEAIGADGVLPPVVLLPSAYGDLAAAPVSWTRLAGDSLALLAAMAALAKNSEVDAGFAAWLGDVEASNPDYGRGAVLLPDTTTALLPDESLRALAARLLMVVEPTALPAVPDDAFRDLIAGADILATLAAAVVTDCRLPADGQTLRSLATLYDLPLETIGRLGADVPGLIRSDAGVPLLIPYPPALELARLVPALTGDVPVRDVAGQASRFMMHGQRLPVPKAGDDGADTLASLYELIGQQVTGPAPDTSLASGTVRVALTVTLSVPVLWLTLIATKALSADDTLETLTAAIPDFAARNPGAALPGRLRPGMVVETADSESLLIDIDEATLDADCPATVLSPLSTSPTALQLWEDVPVRHGLPQMVIWQVAESPGLPVLGDAATGTGMPSFWPFPPALAARAAADTGQSWQLFRTDPERGPDATAVAVDGFAWATLIDIRINRLPGRPHTAEVIGADTAGRQQLLELWQYLDAGADGADLSFSFLCSAAAGLSGGLVSSRIDPDQSYLVRTNLSTETRSGTVGTARVAGTAAPASDLFFAPVSETVDFLTLLWEASVVGGGGYWLELRGADTAGFPDDIWEPDGGAVITLTAVLTSQSAASPERRLYGFNTAALVGDPVEPSATALFVSATGDGDLVRQATVTPGNVGFTFGLANPSDSDRTPDALLCRLYNLAGYRLVETDAFAASDDGRPVGGQLETDDTPQVTQVIPIHRFAKTVSVPSVPGLPPADGDPYAGLSAAGRTAPPTATVALGFHDVFGNITASDDDVETATKGDAQ